MTNKFVIIKDNTMISNNRKISYYFSDEIIIFTRYNILYDLLIYKYHYYMF